MNAKDSTAFMCRLTSAFAACASSSSGCCNFLKASYSAPIPPKQALKIEDVNYLENNKDSLKSKHKSDTIA